MHFEAVAHAQGHASSIHPATVASEAVAMAEAVGHILKETACRYQKLFKRS
jgi:hypothetical protein